MGEGEGKGAFVAIVAAVVVLVGVGIVVLLNWPEKDQPVKAEPVAVAVKAPEKTEEPVAPKAAEPAPAPEAPKSAPAPEPAKVETLVSVAEAPKTGEPIDVMKALEYREEFLPKGYTLATKFNRTAGRSDNPATLGQDELDEAGKKFGAEVTKGYMCVFQGNSPGEMALYLALMVGDPKQAETLRDMIAKDKGGPKATINSFIQGNLVVMTASSDQFVADDLTAKLKKAVNFN